MTIAEILARGERESMSLEELFLSARLYFDPEYFIEVTQYSPDSQRTCRRVAEWVKEHPEHGLMAVLLKMIQKENKIRRIIEEMECLLTFKELQTPEHRGIINQVFDNTRNEFTQDVLRILTLQLPPVKDEDQQETQKSFDEEKVETSEQAEEASSSNEESIEQEGGINSPSVSSVSPSISRNAVVTNDEEVAAAAAEEDKEEEGEVQFKRPRLLLRVKKGRTASTEATATAAAANLTTSGLNTDGIPQNTQMPLSTTTTTSTPVLPALQPPSTPTELPYSKIGLVLNQQNQSWNPTQFMAPLVPTPGSAPVPSQSTKSDATSVTRKRRHSQANPSPVPFNLGIPFHSAVTQTSSQPFPLFPHLTSSIPGFSAPSNIPVSSQHVPQFPQLTGLFSNTTLPSIAHSSQSQPSLSHMPSFPVNSNVPSVISHLQQIRPVANSDPLGVLSNNENAAYLMQTLANQLQQTPQLQTTPIDSDTFQKLLASIAKNQQGQ